MRAAIKIGMKPGRRPARPIGECAQFVAFGGAQIILVETVTKMIVCFDKRRPRDLKETGEVGRMKASKPFGNVYGC